MSFHQTVCPSCQSTNWESGTVCADCGRPHGMNSREKINTDFAVFRAENEAKLYVPGQWMCPKCGFMQGKSFIGANTGNVWANLEVHDEPCPNDGAKMERLTWEQHARDAVRTAMTQLDRALAAEKERDALAFKRPYDCYWSRRTLAAEKLLEQHAHEFKTLRAALDCDGSDLEQLLGAIGRLKRQAEEYRLETHRWAEAERKRQLSELVPAASVPADKCARCRRTDLPLTKIHLIELTLCRPCIDAIDARIQEMNHD